MGWQYTPYALLSLATALFSAGLALYAVRRRGVPGAGMGILFMAAVALWTAANAVELGVSRLSAHLLWSGLAYVGIVVVPVAWFGFTAAYTGRGRLVRGRNLALLFVVPALTLLALFTTGYHRLFWSGWALDTSGPFVGLVVEYGPLFWVWVAYAYALLLAGVVMVVRTLAGTGNL